MKRALVTGGAGFIGSHVCERFLGAGYGVVAIDNLSTGKKENLPKQVDLRVLDIGSPEAAQIVATGGFDVVAHLAAQMDVRRSTDDPLFDARTNIMGTINLVEAARHLPAEKRPRIVFASTGGALYGDDAPVPSSEETPANPDAPYGVAKLAVEFYLGYYARIWELDTAILRFGNVYGPRQNPLGEAGVIAMFAIRLAHGEPLTIYGTGKQTRDFVYVTDVADAFFAASTGPLPPPGPVNARAFNVGTGIDTPVLELAERLGRIAGAKPRIEFKPERRGEVERSLLAPDKMRRQFQWQAQVALDEGLARTFEWVSKVVR